MLQPPIQHASRGMRRQAADPPRTKWLVGPTSHYAGQVRGDVLSALGHVLVLDILVHAGVEDERALRTTE
jgi:hypothetical protein